MKKSDFEELLASVREAGEIMRDTKKASRVSVRTPVEVQAIRTNLKISQSQFARLLGVSVNTIQNWEQGRRTPSGPARAFLSVAAFAPKMVARALMPTY